MVKIFKLWNKMRTRNTWKLFRGSLDLNSKLTLRKPHRTILKTFDWIYRISSRKKWRNWKKILKI